MKPLDLNLHFFINHSNKLLDLAQKVYNSCLLKRNKRKSYFRIVISAGFSRAYILFESILILVKNNRVIDAGILLRSFYNLFVNLCYIKESEEEKEERAILFLYDRTIKLLNLYKKRKQLYYSIGEKSRIDKWINFYEEEKKELEIMLREKNINLKPWNKISIYEKVKSIEKLAETYNLLYADLSRFEHHDFSSLEAFVDLNTCDPVLNPHIEDVSPVLKPELIIWLSNVMFGTIVRDFNEEYQLRWQKKIDEIEKELPSLNNS